MTSEGERVVRCIASGIVLLIYDPSGQTLAAAQSLGPAVGCGSGRGIYTGTPVSGFMPSNEQVHHDDPLSDILKTIFD